MKSAIILSALSAMATVAAWGVPDGMDCLGPCKVTDTTKVYCENCVYTLEDGSNSSGDDREPSEGSIENCFVNKHGMLENRLLGGWAASCKDVSVDDAGIMTASCADGKGGWSKSSIDLTTSHLINTDHGLGCE